MGELQNNRSLSLDVFRGMTVCFMIIVNTPGAGATPFAPLLHAHWHGFTPTDLVFPSFLFAVGNAMSFSMRRQVGNSVFLTKVLRRTLLIFLLGFLLYWFPFFRTDEHGNFGLSPFGETRVMGVLQRIALCYLFASLLIRYFTTRAVMLISVLLLVGYWIILLLFPLEADPYGMLTNAGTRIDKFILGDAHLYHGEGSAFDPEGILSTLPAIVNVIIGYYAGKFFQQKGSSYETVAKFMLYGAALITLAIIWNGFFPINKKLWSSSFVLLTTGLDLCILAALVYLIEIRSFNRFNWAGFFTVFGKNPLFIYLLSELLAITLYSISAANGQSLFQWINISGVQAVFPGPVGSLLFALAFMLICWLVGLVLHKKKIYIKV